MALVKTSKITAGAAKPRAAAKPAAVAAPKPRADRPALGQDQLSERIAAASEQLAAGLAEASAAAEELRRSMEQIAAGAEEAAGGSQEQLAAIASAQANLLTARNQAEGSRRRTEALQIVLVETATQITSSVRAIERNADRQSASIAIIEELERRARDIGEITKTVSRISDQTNLLALNAAIEAARAGDHGRGFAVVADEVRALAETSDASAQQVQSLAEAIQTDVRGVAAAVNKAAETATGEARSGVAVVDTLTAIRADMAVLAEGAQDTLTASLEAERAAKEAQRGAEQVATAAEEQSAGAGEAQSAIQQQAQSLDQGQRAAQSLATVTEDLRKGKVDASVAEEIAATAEELSATVQELSSAASQIMAAVEQINRGSQQQAAATQQTSAALAQIEKSARQAQTNASVSDDRVTATEAALATSRESVEGLIRGVTAALTDTQDSLATIGRLEGVGRRIQGIVDEITLVAVQTSMLAVSGAVEAARAGDAGRGFAVVSNDIRSLAREASESVGRIKETVSGILGQIAVLRRDLEQVITAAETEVQTNRAIVTSLQTLDDDLAALKSANQAISHGAEGILAAAVETASGARQIAAAAEEASSASREAAAASAQQARGAEDLAAAIEEIASLADELRTQNG
ncbi:MAG TPA: methyl-accepting chemotaxis protein [Phenylobacterium sp.]|jgi:methyl-accepting chemotaxis protein|nr:methyl-accepting chemotaxis protein [Phenylobacterium sp.]